MRLKGEAAVLSKTPVPHLTWTGPDMNPASAAGCRPLSKCSKQAAGVGSHKSLQIRDRVRTSISLRDAVGLSLFS